MAIPWESPQNIEIVVEKMPIISTKKYNPGYFFGVDHQNKILLLCIRGTESFFGDYLTDLQAVPKHVTIGNLSGNVHIGIYKSSQHIHSEITSLVHKLKTNQKYTDYEIIVTGHSLGAGCASLLGLIWRYSDDSNMKEIPFTVYSFASPIIVDKDLREKCLNDDGLNIISIAQSTDIVTRIGTAGWQQMLNRTNMIEKIEKTFFESICSEAMNGGNPDSTEKYSERQYKFLNEIQEAKVDEDGLLYPVGRILWFIPKQAMNENVAERNKYLINFVEEQHRRKTYLEFDTMKSLILLQNLDDKLWNEDMFNLYSTTDAALFEENVMLWPESLLDHMPGRYLGCLGITVKEAMDMKEPIDIA